ncbi:MAG TPA: stage II sporulation protein M [Anaerolineae bacterium]|nr:stage II sporulation protein M [Anaerolineae bacterium]
MKVEQFLETRRGDWELLTGLIKQAERGIKHLDPDQVKKMTQLYRAATSDLALAQREFPQDRVTIYLNQLVGRAHGTIYQSEPLAWGRVVHFMRRGLPQAFRQTWRYSLIAALLLFVPAFFGGFLTYFWPETAQWILPPGSEPMVEMIERQELWVDIPANERPFTSSFIMTNNIRVSFLAFAGGVLAGLFTIYILVFNGLMLGGVLGLTYHYDVGFDLTTFIIGHGVIELSVIAFAGGSGLMLGWAIVSPGLYRRRDALVIAARRALTLLLGCIPLLVIAGTIEGFISPNETLPWPVKFMVGIGSGLVMYIYLLWAGREDDDEDEVVL